MLAPQPQDGIEVRGDHVRRREGLERGAPALPDRPEFAVDAREILRRGPVLKVRGEQAEAPFEHGCGAGRA
ncbi:MAG TPA: hypothetical protein VFZ10_10150, partial [Geminicoccaceae bacterium]